MKPTSEFKAISEYTDKEIQQYLEEHKKQQSFRRLQGQLHVISRKPKYQAIRRRAMQRVSLKALMICLIGHGTPLMETPKLKLAL